MTSTCDEIGYGPHATGKAAEASAIAWLSRRNFEIYTAFGSHSLCDLIAVKRHRTGRPTVMLIEVRATDYTGNRHRRLSPEQVENKVRLLTVSPDGNCAWHDAPDKGSIDC